MNNQYDAEHRRTSTSVCVCGRCQGEGSIVTYDPSDTVMAGEPRVEICPLCLGSGLVVRRRTVTLTIEPFRPRYK